MVRGGGILRLASRPMENFTFATRNSYKAYHAMMCARTGSVSPPPLSFSLMPSSFCLLSRLPFLHLSLLPRPPSPPSSFSSSLPPSLPHSLPPFTSHHFPFLPHLFTHLFLVYVNRSLPALFCLLLSLPLSPPRLKVSVLGVQGHPKGSSMV